MSRTPHNLVWNEDLAWFPRTRCALSDSWHSRSELILGAPTIGGCGVLFSDVVDLSNGHVSIACSLVDDCDQVSSLLASTCFDDNPILFFRLLLFLLDEFTERISECHRLVGHSKARQPANISLWANRYAKHKPIFFIQHHARHVFQDGHGPMFSALNGRRQRPGFCLRSGMLPETVFSMDESWLRSNAAVDLTAANNNLVPAVLIPHLSGFTDAALDFLQAFIEIARKQPQRLVEFQSPFHWPIPPELELAIGEILSAKLSGTPATSSNIELPPK